MIRTRRRRALPKAARIRRPTPPRRALRPQAPPEGAPPAWRGFLARARRGELPLEPLPADASDRAFRRLRLPPGSSPPTAIFACGIEPPFVEHARALRRAGIPVPEVFASDEAAGVVLEEDLGDALLADAVSANAPLSPLRAPGLAALYERAVDTILEMQERLRPGAFPTFPGLERAFDAATFERELLFFEEHAWRGLFGARPTPGETRALHGAFRRLARDVASAPLRFAHRDFHSRNLLVRPGGGLGVVDFQDARLGPPHYDLVSLLFDAYAELDPDFARALRERFEKAARPFPAREASDRAFLLTAAQRVLKALGSFGYLARVKGKARFLDFVPKATRDAGAILRSRTELGRLRALLATAVPAWA